MFTVIMGEGNKAHGEGCKVGKEGRSGQVKNCGKSGQAAIQYTQHTIHTVQATGEENNVMAGACSQAYMEVVWEMNFPFSQFLFNLGN